MLLAEALRERADAQRQLAGLRDRIGASARHTEGEEPTEDASALLAEAEDLIDHLAHLIATINQTNLASQMPDGRTVTQALADRDALRSRFGLLQGAADSAAGKGFGFLDRIGRQELRTFPTLDVTALRQRADQVARDIRTLDIAIQQINVTTELA